MTLRNIPAFIASPRHCGPRPSWVSGIEVSGIATMPCPQTAPPRIPDKPVCAAAVDKVHTSRQAMPLPGRSKSSVVPSPKVTVVACG